MKPKEQQIVVGVALAVIAVAYFALTGWGDDDAPGSLRLSGEVPVGLLLPLTGDLAPLGEEILTFSKLAEADVNDYLREQGEPWTMRLVLEDTATDPAVALEKAALLHAGGVRAVVGPASSANVESVKEYADSNDMLILSCCSSSPGLAVPGDSVYRMVPSELYESEVLARLVKSHGIDVLIPVYRGDTWGEGVVGTVRDVFSELGGTVEGGVRYNPESPEFAASAPVLADMVRGMVEEHGSDRVAVLLSSYGEGLGLVRLASSYEILDDVNWFGSAALTQDQGIVDDPVVGRFSSSVGLTSIVPSVHEGAARDRVVSATTEQLGREPTSFLTVAYDAVWVMALTMQEAQSVNAADMKAVIADVVSRYGGTTGDIRLNEAGDLASADYEVWGVRDGQWEKIGVYTGADGSLALDSIFKPGRA